MAVGAKEPGTATDAAAVSGSVQWETTRGGGSPAAPRRAPADAAILMDSAGLAIAQGGPAASKGGPGDAATLIDSAEYDLVRAQPGPAGDGGGESAQLPD